MSIVNVLLAAWAGLAPGAASAAGVWLCGLSDDLVRLVCIADADPIDEPTGTTAVVHGTRFPLDRGRRWEVDLWSPPNDFAEVEILARATICYRSPGCEVIFGTPNWRVAAR